MITHQSINSFLKKIDLNEKKKSKTVITKTNSYKYLRIIKERN